MHEIIFQVKFATINLHVLCLFKKTNANANTHAFDMSAYMEVHVSITRVNSFFSQNVSPVCFVSFVYMHSEF